MMTTLEHVYHIYMTDSSKINFYELMRNPEYFELIILDEVSKEDCKIDMKLIHHTCSNDVSYKAIEILAEKYPNKVNWEHLLTHCSYKYEELAKKYKKQF